MILFYFISNDLFFLLELSAREKIILQELQKRKETVLKEIQVRKVVKNKTIVVHCHCFRLYDHASFSSKAKKNTLCQL